MSLYHICFVDLVGIRVKPIADTYLISRKVTFFLSKMGLFSRKSLSNGCDMPFPCLDCAVYGTFPVAVPAASVPVLVCRAADAWESAVNLADSAALFAKTAAFSQNSAALFCVVSRQSPEGSRRWPLQRFRQRGIPAVKMSGMVEWGSENRRFHRKNPGNGQYGTGLFRRRRPALDCRCERLIAPCTPSCRFRGAPGGFQAPC